MSRTRKLLFALLALALLIALAEIGLRLPPSLRHAGHFFEREPDGSVRFVASSSDSVFNDPKPANTYRIFCFGGSAVEGSIYNPRSTFPKLLGEMLSDLSRGVRVEVVNCGMSAVNSDVILESVRAARAYQPDLMVIYTGNNELPMLYRINRVNHPAVFAVKTFLERRSRIYYLAKGGLFGAIGAGAGLFEGDSVDAGWDRPQPRVAEQNLEAYRRNLESMTGRARSISAEAILAAPVVNERDWPPQRSACDAAPDECRSREEKVDQAEKMIGLGRADDARRLVDEVLSRAPDHARAHFLAGRLALARGEPDVAADHFRAALENDQTVLRRTKPSQLQVLRELAERKRLPLVDVQTLFDRQSPYGVTGFNLIDDYCHPSLDGQALVAAALAAEISARHPELFRPAERDRLWQARQNYLRRLGVGPEFIALRLQEMAFYLAFSFDDRGINDQALALLLRQRELAPGSALPTLIEGLLRLRQSAPEPARTAFERALRETPDHAARMADLYFRRFLRWEPPYLLVRSHPGIKFHSILNDYLAKQKTDSKLGLEQADRVYLLKGSALVDVTTSVLPRVEQRRRLAPGATFGLYPPAGGLRVSVVGLRNEGDNYTATAADPRLVFGPLDLDPLAYGALEVELDATNPPPKQRVCLYWRDPGQPYFQEERKACSEEMIAGGSGIYLVPLSDDPDWVLSPSIRGLRLDPGESAFSFRLRQVQLLPWEPPAK